MVRLSPRTLYRARIAFMAIGAQLAAALIAAVLFVTAGGYGQ